MSLESFSGFDFGFSDIALEAFDVPSFTDSFGTEYLNDAVGLNVPGVDLGAFNFDQVGSFAGDAQWFDAVNPGEIVSQAKSLPGFTDFGSAFDIGGFNDLAPVFDLGEFAGLDEAIAAQQPGFFEGVINAGKQLGGDLGTMYQNFGEALKNPVFAAFAVPVIANVFQSNPVLGTALAAAPFVNAAFTPGADGAAGGGFANLISNPAVVATALTLAGADPRLAVVGALAAPVAGVALAGGDVGAAATNLLSNPAVVGLGLSLAGVDPALAGAAALGVGLATQPGAVDSTALATNLALGFLGPVGPNNLQLIPNAFGFPGAYGANGQLLPGFAINPTTGQPFFQGIDIQARGLQPVDLAALGQGIVDPNQLAIEESIRNDAALNNGAGGLQGLIDNARQQQTLREQRNIKSLSGDWRVRLSLAPRSTYLYNASDCGPVLWPLRQTDGIIFPYTPKIDIGYKANYSSYDLTHSNYRGYFYQNSYVDAVNVTATFTAQDTNEANYLLAVIHFLRSATKMFYGQDSERGSPPPLVYMRGLGDYQFSDHPCVISQFNYNLPADVDYIRAQTALESDTNLLQARDRQYVASNPLSYAINRLASVGLPKGATPTPFSGPTLGKNDPSYVPTKIELSLTLLPVQSRQQVSKQFSVKNFANGNLLKGGFW